MSCCSKPKKQDDHHHSHGSCCSKPEKQDDHHHSHGSCCSAPEQPSREESQGSCCSSKSKSPSQQEGKNIHRHMTIEDILSLFPYKAQRLAQEITNAGLHCVGCQAAVWETLEGGMLGHGKTDKQINELVDRLNALLNEPLDLNSIRLTPRGAAKFIELAADEEKQGWGVRFGEEMAGCSGFEYYLDFSEKPDSDDQVFESNGIEIHIKKALLPRLMGSEIDYVEGIRGSGFKISNPNAGSSCGCGSSHNY